MGDFLLEMRGPGRRILKTLNVPLPPALKRAEGPWLERPLDGRTVVVGGAAMLPDLYARAGANVVSADPRPYKPAAEAFSRSAEATCEGKVDALVYDATHLRRPEQLREAFDGLQPWVRRVKQRVVVLARPEPRVVGGLCYPELRWLWSRVSLLPGAARLSAAPGHACLFSLPTGFDVAQVNTLVREANRRVQDLCQQYDVPYVDVFAMVLEGDELSRAYAATDGYHINVSGYAAIAEMLRSSVFAKIDSPQIGNDYE